MATMYPKDGPAPCTAESKEAEVYHLLHDSLPRDYVVVHSLPVQRVNQGEFEIVEIDFAIFHPAKGLLTLEVKAGTKFDFTRRGIVRQHNDGNSRQETVHEQAYRAWTCLMDKFKEKKGDSDRYGFCKSNYAVWFLDVSSDDEILANLPTWYDRECTLTLEDRVDPRAAIGRVMALNREDGSYHKMNQDQVERFLSEFLVPEGVFSSTEREENAILGGKLFELTEAQKRVLEYLRYEKVAAVTGIGGTGKSVIAKERARQLSRHGRRVLYLCYNRLFGKELQEEFKDIRNITAMTVDGFAAKLINPESMGYETLEAWEDVHDTDRYTELSYIILSASEKDEDGNFRGLPECDFDDLIIDEAQDFNKPGMDALWDAIISLDKSDTFLRQRGGSLYLFYDELQVEPGLTLPKQLAEVKCRLALYVSCRSSHEIAAFGLNALGRKRVDGLRPRSSETASGHAPRVVFLSNGARPSEVRDAISREINRLKTVGIAEDEITVLSCRAKDGQNGTRLLPFAKLRGGMRYWDGTHARFETVRTFKGKESDAVIVAEVDETVWDVSRDGTDALDGVLLYLGATRARMELTVVVQMDDSACGRAMKKLDAKVSGPRGRIAFAKYLGADMA